MSNTLHEYDIAILGGGCTGLNFAMKYAQSTCVHKILILEERETYNHDRNWSFWLERGKDFAHSDIVKKTWPAWTFSSDIGIITHHSNNYEYATIASGDFYDKAIAHIKKDDRQNLISGCRVIDISICESYEIQTNKGVFSAKTIIDTRNSKHDDFQAKAGFYQIFYGYEIETETPFFDDAQLSLMEHMQNIEGGLSFIYALPFSKTKALIEYTIFTKKFVAPDTLQSALDKHIQRNLPQGRYMITAKEKAVLPMGAIKMRNPLASQSYIYAGTRAGALRESSGYGFLRIYNWAQKAVADLENQKTIKAQAKPAALNHFIDRHFIKTLQNSPEFATEIFIALSKNTNADVFARFMSENYNATDLLNIILAVPKTPSLKALVQK